MAKTNKYYEVHNWLKKNYGKANRCESATCDSNIKRYEWVNVNGHKYKKDRYDFMMLCTACHSLYDNKYKLMNKATTGKLQNREYRRIKGKYPNIYYRPSRNRWFVMLNRFGTQYYGGCSYRTEEEAHNGCIEFCKQKGFEYDAKRVR